jgi:phage tail sheath protein FI
MTAYLRPGVFVEESLNLTAPVQSTTSQSIAAFIGYTDRGPIDPTLVTSWSQYVSLYGGWTKNAKMHTALLLFFSNGGSQAYVKRVASSTADNSSRTINDRASTPDATLTIESANVGSWGSNVNVTISESATAGSFDLTVFYGGIAATNIVERYTDLTMTATDDRYAVALVNSQSKFITLVDEGSAALGVTRNPVVTSNAYLISGTDGTSLPTDALIAAAVTSFDVVVNSLVLNAPGISEATSVNLLTAYAENRGDVFVVIDPIAGTTTAPNQIVRADSYTATSYGAVYYPEIVIKDPTTNTQGVTASVSPGGAIVGLYLSTDASRGVFKAPAGLQTRVGGAISVKPLTNSELDALNSNNAAVNAIKFVPGSGIVVMGSRTLQGTYVDRYVPVRRTLIYLRKSMSDLSQFAIFEPNDERLWRSITASLEGFLNNFWREGGLRGAVPSQAFYVKCDSETNPQSAIDGGQVNIEVGVALQRPAEFVIIKIGQFDGGTTVTVA